jgi:ABC-type branched-subunit amino acid transport system permease subunit
MIAFWHHDGAVVVPLTGVCILRDAGVVLCCWPALSNLLIGYGGLLSFGHAMFHSTAG